MSTALKMVGGTALAKLMLKRLDRLQDRNKANARAVLVVDRWIQKNFQSQGKLATGSGWKPLAPQTVAQRRKQSDTILQDKGKLKSEWKHYWNHKIGMLTSGVPYGKPHDEGTNKIPQRKILPEEKQIMPQLVKIYGEFVEVSIK